MVKNDACWGMCVDNKNDHKVDECHWRVTEPTRNKRSLERHRVEHHLDKRPRQAKNGPQGKAVTM